ncbi:MAG: hypothetical protein J0L81_05090 [Caulobacterales bacterium]|jgi:hypothetical protein|nr:hypothetical protein [Caulobacterales bacterium]
MARPKNITEFEIKVEGEPYIWRLQRGPQWSNNPIERRGKAIAVRHKEGTREAIIEFPAGPPPKFGAPVLKASQIPTLLVARAIQSAIGAGWEPMSRGKPVPIVVDETGA